MKTHHLSSYDLDSIQTVEDALLLIEINLDELIGMSSVVLVDSEDKTIMKDNVDFIKRYYERAELLLMKEPS